MRSEGTTPTAWKPGIKPGMRQSLYTSPDGFEWTPYENNPVIDTAPKIGRWGPTYHMGWDPIRQVYAVFMEQCLHRGCPQGQRIIGRSESSDMTRWTPDQNVLIQDELDYPDTEFYSMPVMAYEGIYIGLPWIFRTTNTLHYPQLAFSRDGIRFERRYRQPFLCRWATRGILTRSTIYVHQPMVRDGEIRIYYYGGNWRGSESLHAQGDRAMFAVGLATVREDGFVSVDAGKIHPGSLTTRFLSFEGPPPGGEPGSRQAQPRRRTARGPGRDHRKRLPSDPRLHLGGVRSGPGDGKARDELAKTVGIGSPGRNPGATPLLDPKREALLVPVPTLNENKAGRFVSENPKKGQS